MAPTLDVTEPNEFIAIECNNSLAAINLFGNILGRTLGNTRATLQSRFVYQLTDILSILSMRGGHLTVTGMSGAIDKIFRMSGIYAIVDRQ